MDHVNFKYLIKVEFQNAVMKNIGRILCIELNWTIAYRPSSHGQAEMSQSETEMKSTQTAREEKNVATQVGHREPLVTLPPPGGWSYLHLAEIVLQLPEKSPYQLVPLHEGDVQPSLGMPDATCLMDIVLSTIAAQFDLLGRLSRSLHTTREAGLTRGPELFEEHLRRMKTLRGSTWLKAFWSLWNNLKRLRTFENLQLSRKMKTKRETEIRYINHFE